MTLGSRRSAETRAILRDLPNRDALGPSSKSPSQIGATDNAAKLKRTEDPVKRTSETLLLGQKQVQESASLSQRSTPVSSSSTRSALSVSNTEERHATGEIASPHYNHYNCGSTDANTSTTGSVSDKVGPEVCASSNINTNKAAITASQTSLPAITIIGGRNNSNQSASTPTPQQPQNEVEEEAEAEVEAEEEGRQTHAELEELQVETEIEEGSTAAASVSVSVPNHHPPGRKRTRLKVQAAAAGAKPSAAALPSGPRATPKPKEPLLTGGIPGTITTAATAATPTASLRSVRPSPPRVSSPAGAGAGAGAAATATALGVDQRLIRTTVRCLTLPCLFSVSTFIAQCLCLLPNPPGHYLLLLCFGAFVLQCSGHGSRPRTPEQVCRPGFLGMTSGCSCISACARADTADA